MNFIITDILGLRRRLASTILSAKCPLCKCLQEKSLTNLLLTEPLLLHRLRMRCVGVSECKILCSRRKNMQESNFTYQIVKPRHILFLTVDKIFFFLCRYVYPSIYQELKPVYLSTFTSNVRFFPVIHLCSYTVMISSPCTESQQITILFLNS